MKEVEEMKIRKRGNKWEMSRMKDGVRYYVTLDFKPSQREAEEIMQKHIASRSCVQNESHGMTFGQAGEAYIQLKCNVISPSTIIGYRGIIRRLPEWFTKRKLDKITALDVQKVVNDISITLSAKSVRNFHGFISAVLSTYRPDVHLNTKMPQKRQFERHTPTDAEVRQILEAVKGTEYEIPYRLAVYGMRKGEICAISAQDLDGCTLTINKSFVLTESDGWIIKPYPKTTESERKIHIDEELAALIREKDDRVFKGWPNRLTNHLHDLQDEMNIPRFRLHDFRAYYASMAHALGIPDKFIMAHCGWKSTQTMDRIYKHAQADMMEEMEAKAMAHIFGS